MTTAGVLISRESWKTRLTRRLRSDEKVDIALSPTVSIRVYADCRPNLLQTTNLQKGLVLLWRGNELIEEGLGFGVPICRYSDGTRFSLSADTYVDDSGGLPSIRKVYDMNGIVVKRLRGLQIRRGSYLARFLGVLEKAYRGIRRLQPGAVLMLGLFSVIGIRNEYHESSSKGQIAVAYQLARGSLKVRATFDNMDTDALESLILANEQGGRLFTEYSDSCDVELKESQIEPWRRTAAEWAALRCPETGLGFRVHKPQGWRIVRGREVVEQRMSWSGLDLVSNKIPTKAEYLVEILGGTPND